MRKQPFILFPDCSYEMSLDEIAKEIGISKQGVDQIIKRALEKIRLSGNLDAFKDLIHKETRSCTM